MLYHLHRFKLMVALSLTLAAVVAAPAAARPQDPFGPIVSPSHPSTQASTNRCEELCLSAISRLGYKVTPPRRPLQPLAGEGKATLSTGSTVVRAVGHDNGFAWDDAGIGAGVAIAALAAVVGGAAATTTRRARRLRGSGAVAG